MTLYRGFWLGVGKLYQRLLPGSGKSLKLQTMSWMIVGDRPTRFVPSSRSDPLDLHRVAPRNPRKSRDHLKAEINLF